jgi:hypothetical protein
MPRAGAGYSLSTIGVFQGATEENASLKITREELFAQEWCSGKN